MIKRLLCLTVLLSGIAHAGTVSGILQGPSGLPVKNGTLNFILQQAGLINGTGAVVPITAYCYTSTDGTVVGLPNPSVAPNLSINYGSGTLGAGIYYIQYTFLGAIGETLPSVEGTIQLTSAGTLIVTPPVSIPAGTTGINVYLGETSGGEQLQGEGTTTAPFILNSNAILSGPAPPTSNAVPCSIAFNDTIIPYSGYNVSLLSSTGNAYPGWPQAWQLNGGPSGTLNISNGAPLWNGTVVYPMPILSQPLNHGPQSISGLLNMTGYNLVNVGELGVGTSTPGYPLDVENGYINTNLGYLVAGGAGTTGQCLVSNGTFFGPGSCGTLPTIYYQHLEYIGSVLPQEPFLNFNSTLSAVDNPGSTRTELGLPTTGVTAGSYTNSNVTVDAEGRITTASNGPSIPVIKSLIINSGICTTSNTAFSSCSTPASGQNLWPTAFADSSYSVACTAFDAMGTNAVLGSMTIHSKSASGFVLTLQNSSGSGAGNTTVNEIDCVGVHP